ncbi:MAG: hypothetical protein J6O62_03350 [Bacilli bacterium]|nr:hypothetical protein [Bacilli bacterium]MBO6195762.1 hypothetical protein [Bacilli bacterium]
MKGKIKSLIKNKRFIIFLILLVVFFICIFFLRGVFFTGSGSKYGNRLDGINKISFTDKDQKSITDSISADEKVSTAKIVIHGKIINVIFNVNKDVSVDDAKAIAQASLEKFSNEVKGFYDIQYMITNTEEVGEEVQTTNQDGSTTTEVKKKFPIMGYKNSNKDSIVW